MSNESKSSAAPRLLLLITCPAFVVGSYDVACEAEAEAIAKNETSRGMTATLYRVSSEPWEAVRKF